MATDRNNARICIKQYFEKKVEQQKGDKMFNKIYCLFEQSGTFKNEFKKLGLEAFDYDIQDDFGETDYICDLFVDIEEAYENRESIFDDITQNDLIIAFFPCIRFEDQIQMHFRGTAIQMKNWTTEQKLENDLKLHRELSQMYGLVTKLAIICLRRKIPLIIENPYSTTHYLVKYWAIPATIIDKDRTIRGDFYKKPTQYYFINCEPKYNMILEPQIWNKTKTITNTSKKIDRSLISQEYANRFIREFIV